MENRTPNCVCVICKVALYRRPFQLEKGPVFCSRECSNKRHSNLRKPCPICGIVMKWGVRHCSRTCSNKSRTGLKYGVGAPNDKVSKYQKLKTVLVNVRGAKCNRCDFNVIEVIEIHHILEQCNNGSDDPDNLELLCPNCHALHHYLTKSKKEKNNGR